MTKRARPRLREGFEYEFSPVDPVAGAHIDPPSAAICETLVFKSPEGVPVPGLAHRWEISGDGTTWRFHLRENLWFHDGSPCDARAVHAALERCRWGDTRTRQLHYFDPVAVIEPEGDLTVVIRSHYPTTRVMSLLWGTHTTIFCESVRASLGADYGRAAAAGTGPFALSSWSNERIVARRSTTYSPTPSGLFSNLAAPHLAEIEWLAITDEAERLRLLDHGEIDCLHAPPANALDALGRDERFVAFATPQSSNVYFALDWRRRDLGFHRVAMRQALSLAVDRDAIVDSVLCGKGHATYGPVAPEADFFDARAIGLGRYDAHEATRLLESEGWAVGHDGVRHREGQPLEFGCVVQDDSVLMAAAAMVRKQLALVGVRLMVEPVKPFGQFYQRLSLGADSFLSKWLWPDPIDALYGFTATACQPRPNWQFASVPLLDDAFDRFRRATEATALQEAASRVQHLIAEELPIIPLFTPHDLWVCDRQLAEWRPTGQNLYPYYQDVRMTNRQNRLPRGAVNRGGNRDG